MINYDSIENKIDEAFKNTFCEPRRDIITTFFKKIMEDVSFHVADKNDSTSVIQVIYNSTSPLEYILVEQSPFLRYQSDQTKFNDIKLETYNYWLVEDIAKHVIQSEGIEIDEDYFESSQYWENQRDLEIEFILECWRNAKRTDNSTVIGLLISHDGSGGYINMDLGDEIDDDNIIDHLEAHGINSSCFISNKNIETDDNEVKSFWKKLIGK